MKRAASPAAWILALLLPACGGQSPPKSSVVRGPSVGQEMDRALNLALRAVEQYERRDPEHALVSLRMAEEVVRAAAKNQGVTPLELLTARLPAAYRKYNLQRMKSELEGLVQRGGAPGSNLSIAQIPNPTPPPETDRVQGEGRPLIVEDTIYPGASGGNQRRTGAISSNNAAGLPTGLQGVAPPQSVEVHRVDDTTYVRNELDRLMAEFGETTFNPPQSFIAEIHRTIAYFQTSQRSFFQTTLQRSVQYSPLIEKLFQKKGVPADLVYMAFVESGFRPDALSHSGARGLWQFMPRTAQQYGLQVGRGVDERLDPVKSTLAAREYFLDLLSIFGTRSWMLAMAAYNAGENKIAACLKQIDDPFAQRTFWHIRDCLRTETQDYVPRILAAAIIASDPARFGFQPARMAPQRPYETVALPGHTTVSALLQTAGIDRMELMDLNPDLAPEATTTPPASSTQPYRLNVPTGAGNRVVQAWPELARVGLSVRPSTDWSPALVAKNSTRPATGSGKGGGATKKPSAPYFVYRVAAGNTLAGIADAFGVGSYKEIMRWNSTKRSAVAESQQLKIYRPYRKVAYKVRKGDTLEKVGKRFQVSVAQLRFYNGLGRKSLVPGQVLHVYVRSG